jgi:hypothetical protein|tara:strand:- start:727 stop:912 length:186 start_codon:yes stop_codon:yes gene_type:complete
MRQRLAEKEASMEKIIDKSRQYKRMELLTQPVLRKTLEVSAIIMPQVIFICFIMYWFHING